MDNYPMESKITKSFLREQLNVHMDLSDPSLGCANDATELGVSIASTAHSLTGRLPEASIVAKISSGIRKVDSQKTRSIALKISRSKAKKSNAPKETRVTKTCKNQTEVPEPPKAASAAPAVEVAKPKCTDASEEGTTEQKFEAIAVSLREKARGLQLLVGELLELCATVAPAEAAP